MGTKNTIIIRVLLVLAVLFVVGDVYVWQKHRAVPNSAESSVTPTPVSTPPSLGTPYITPVDWPPKVQVLNQAFSCTPTGSPIGQGGQTMKGTINGHEYCITETSEGVAGSIYSNYTYAFARGDKTVTLTFSLRRVQCANYEEPQKTACKEEQSKFDIGYDIDKLAQGVKL